MYLLSKDISAPFSYHGRFLWFRSAICTSSTESELIDMSHNAVNMKLYNVYADTDKTTAKFG